jgi:hypothetical protein
MKSLSFILAEIFRGFGGSAPILRRKPRARALPYKNNAAAAAPLRHRPCPSPLDRRAGKAYLAGMIRFFNIADHARLPARFFGMTRTVLARL